MERLHKALARAGVASRRAAERLIRSGRVTVNGRVVDGLGSQVDPVRDAILVDGRRIPSPPAHNTYLALNKPRGCLTTLEDPRGRATIRDLIGEVGTRVFPVGRLDFHSEGLLILTDDGELARELTHPRSHVPKTYHVKVHGSPDARALERLRLGVVLDGRRTLPARVRLLRPGENPWLEISIVEGRNRQIRRMCLAVGHRVAKLRRIAIGGLSLGRLASGEVRRLSRAEVARLRGAARGSGAGSRGHRP
jgi:pseudouridine synthase